MVIARFQRANSPVRVDVRVAAPGCADAPSQKGTQSMDVSSCVVQGRVQRPVIRQRTKQSSLMKYTKKVNRSVCLRACVHMYVYRCACVCIHAATRLQSW